MADLSELNGIPPQPDRGDPRDAGGPQDGGRPSILHRSRRPQAPTTIDELRERLVSTGKPGRVPAGKVMHIREDMESAHGADMVMAVAAMAAQVQGFPDDVVIDAPDAERPNKEWVAIQRQGNGLWRIITERPNHPSGGEVFSGWNRESLIHMIGRAMALPELSRAGHDTLKLFGAMPKLPEEVEPFMAAIESSVPTHVLAAPLRQGFGSNYTDKIGTSAVIADAWVKAMAARKVYVNQPATSPADNSPLLAHVGKDVADMGLVKALLDAGADIEARDVEGKSALLTSLRKGRVDIAKLLLDRGADATLRDRDGLSAVDHLIVGLGWIGYGQKTDPSELARELMDAGCVDRNDDEYPWSEKLCWKIDKQVEELEKMSGSSFADHMDKTISMMRKVLAVLEEGPSQKPR
jgi:hypothetical protein